MCSEPENWIEEMISFRATSMTDKSKCEITFLLKLNVILGKWWFAFWWINDAEWYTFIYKNGHVLEILAHYKRCDALPSIQQT